MLVIKIIIRKKYINIERERRSSVSALVKIDNNRKTIKKEKKNRVSKNQFNPLPPDKNINPFFFFAT